MASKKSIKDLRKECKCEELDYCPLEALLESLGDRVLEQHKLVEYFKYSIIKKDISWSDAYKLWVSEGYAKTFSDAYIESQDYLTLRRMIFGRK